MFEPRNNLNTKHSQGKQQFVLFPLLRLRQDMICIA